MFDYVCSKCGHTEIDVWEPVRVEVRYCRERTPQGPWQVLVCGAKLERAWLTKPPTVIGDEIPGGIDIKNGICWPDGSPRRYYSKSDMKKEADKQGLVNRVRHVPRPGSDKSSHTTRWV